MKSAPIQIRRLAPPDAALYRDIRLEALQRNPEAYGSTFETENAQPLAWFSDRLAASMVFGAFHGSELVGIAGLLIGEGQEEAHKALLVGMYVRPSSRKAGDGRELIETIIEFARERVELIQLAVVSDNEQAWQLYARLGFLKRFFHNVIFARDARSDKD
ncbi:MAG: GNAT family N-acetyltransferase [Terriglobales bacterium]